MALLLKLSRNEHYAIILFFCKIKNLMQIRFTPVYGDRCFTKPTIHVRCKKMLGGQKFASDTELQSVIRLGLDSS